MKRIEERIGEMVRELPLEFQYEVEDFVRFLLEKQTRKPKTQKENSGGGVARVIMWGW